MRQKEVRDIPELVGVLQEQKARTKDYIVPAGGLTSSVNGEVCLRFNVNQEDGAWPIQKQVHSQLSEKTGINGKYYAKMLEEAKDLLQYNLNYWFDKLKGQGKKYLVRTIDGQIRAFLSDRYRPIDHLDLLTTAIQVITGKDGQENSFARGARCFSWLLSPTNLDICLVNPSMQVDLNNLDRGVFDGEYTTDDHGWFRPDYKRDTIDDRVLPGGPHIVFPACRITNSETGHGGLGVQPGLVEAICINAAWVGAKYDQRHLGKTLEMDDLTSNDTIKKQNLFIYAKVQDYIRSVFAPEEFLVMCKELKGLEKIEVNATEVINNIVKLDGITEDMRDYILSAYNPIGRKDTMLDVQRAVTRAAQAYDEDGGSQEKMYILEELGGNIVANPKLIMV